MPWNDKPGGSGGGGPWGGGGGGGGGDKGGGGPGGGDKTPWGRPGKPGGGGDRPDLEESLRRMQERFRRRGGGGGGNGGGGKGPMSSRGLGAAGVGVIVAVAFVGWLMTGVYQVNEQESAVVLRLGVPDRTEGPGFHIRWPSPVEDHIKVQLNRPYATEIGAADVESLMLTGDEKIIDIDFVVNWKVDVPQKYLFNVVDRIDGENVLIQQVAESAMREVVGTSAFEGVITRDRAQVEERVRTLMQQVLNGYDSGIEVQSISLRNAQAPADVKAAQLGVTQAEQDRATRIAQAGGYRADIIPKAKGDALAIIQQAEGYRDSTIAIAEGEAARFLLLYNEYKLAPRVTRERMFLETMEKIIERVNTTIIDTKSGAVPILPLDQLRGRTAQ